jgi:hypothetical protein
MYASRSSDRETTLFITKLTILFYHMSTHTVGSERVNSWQSQKTVLYCILRLKTEY